MEEEILFRERQRFNQWWLWLILIIANGINIYALYQFKHSGDNIKSDVLYIIICLLVFLITVLFLSVHLDTKITKEGIYIRFFPFHLISYRHYTWDKIEKCYVRKYNPILEYGGWGIRIGMFGKGKALNVSGNEGIQLVMKSGKRLLIGTNKAEEAKEALMKCGHLNEE